MKVSTDCKYFLGDKPCIPNKESGKVCQCDEYTKCGKRILIIKLGAIGDVIRTTPIIRKLREVYKNCEITWLTHTPEVLDGIVDHVLKLTLENAINLLADSFDIVYNFDKSKEACSILNLVKARSKKGFKMLNGKCAPADKDAEHKFLTGVFDQVGIDSKTSYPEDVFLIAGLSYSKQRYMLPEVEPFSNPVLDGLKRPIVGLNTGCGKGWPSRLWPKEYWIELASLLNKNGVVTILLGGEDEHEKNLEISKKTNVIYPGTFPLKPFISLINKCDLIVTSVTMALHIALGLNKKVLLFNNIFNKNEFELYGLGEILEPKKKSKFYDTKPDNSLKEIKPTSVYKKVISLLNI